MIDVIYGLNSPAGIRVSADSRHIYVVEATVSTLAVIDAATHQIIDNAIYDGENASGGLALTPNGKELYVTNNRGAFGFATKDLIQTQELPKTGIFLGVAVSPNGKTVYLTGSDSNGGEVEVFDTAGNGKLVTNIPVGRFVFNVAFTPNGERAYVTVTDVNSSVCVIDVKTNSVVGPAITGLQDVSAIDVAPNGKTVYAQDLQGIGIINTKTNTVSSTIDLSSYGLPGGSMALTPDGKYLYVPRPGEGGGKGNLVIIDTATNAVTTSVPLGDSPVAVAISPDGRHAYVADDQDSTVTVIAISGD